MIQKTYVMLKPDAIARRYIGKILTRFEDKGLKMLKEELYEKR